MRVRGTTNIQLLRRAKKIPFFRGVYMLDTLPNFPLENEKGIVNIAESTDGSGGTHWICYVKYGKKSIVFDSFGDLRPPEKLVNYLGKNIYYNQEQYQNLNQSNCGELCIQFLKCH